MKGILIANWIILGLAGFEFLNELANGTSNSSTVWGAAYLVLVAVLNAKAWTLMEENKTLKAAAKIRKAK